MLELTGWGASRHDGRAKTKVARGKRPAFDPLESRALMVASLASRRCSGSGSGAEHDTANA